MDIFYINLTFVQGADAFKPISYSAQYNVLKQLFADHGIQSSVKTQMGRKTAAAAENSGAAASSVDKQGHWAVRTRDGAYANHVIPWEAVRVLAGFGPERNRY
jgi:hypothetical protein